MSNKKLFSLKIFMNRLWILWKEKKWRKVLNLYFSRSTYLFLTLKSVVKGSENFCNRKSKEERNQKLHFFLIVIVIWHFISVIAIFKLVVFDVQTHKNVNKLKSACQSHSIYFGFCRHLLLLLEEGKDTEIFGSSYEIKRKINLFVVN